MIKAHVNSQDVSADAFVSKNIEIEKLRADLVMLQTLDSFEVKKESEFGNLFKMSIFELKESEEYKNLPTKVKIDLINAIIWQKGHLNTDSLFPLPVYMEHVMLRER